MPSSISSSPMRDGTSNILGSDSPSESGMSSPNRSRLASDESIKQEKPDINNSPNIKRERPDNEEANSDVENLKKKDDESKDGVKQEGIGKEEDFNQDEPKKKFPKTYPFPHYVERIAKLLPASNPFKENPAAFVNCRNLVSQSLRSGWQDRYRSSSSAQETSSFLAPANDTSVKAPPTKKSKGPSSSQSNGVLSPKLEAPSGHSKKKETSHGRKTSKSSSKVPDSVSSPSSNHVESASSPEKSTNGRASQNRSKENRSKKVTVETLNVKREKNSDSDGSSDTSGSSDDDDTDDE